jgi:NAD-dependent SIR2 family protein deacetylase
VAMHFTAKDLHNIIYEKVKKNKRLTIVHKNIDNPEKLDSDYVLVCSGSPKEIHNNEYSILEELVVSRKLCFKPDTALA